MLGTLIYTSSVSRAFSSVFPGVFPFFPLGNFDFFTMGRCVLDRPGDVSYSRFFPFTFFFLSLFFLCGLGEVG